MKYTYRGYRAHLGLTGDRQCIVPDQVADDQAAYEGKSFIALVPAGWRGTGTHHTRRMRVRLVGDDYNLYESGTGDMRVRPVTWLSKYILTEIARNRN